MLIKEVTAKLAFPGSCEISALPCNIVNMPPLPSGTGKYATHVPHYPPTGHIMLPSGCIMPPSGLRPSGGIMQPSGSIMCP